MKPQLLIKHLITLIIVTAFTFSGLSQDQGFIYGKVTTIDEDVYQGQIRWGKEEAYWTDLFNSAKRYNDNIDYLSRRDVDQLYEDKYRGRHEVSRWFNIGIRFDEDESFTHQFTTQFGNIKSLLMVGRSRVEVELKNGEKIEVDGEGYNDIGEEIRILDQDLGEIELRWSRIDKIEFMNTPSKLSRNWGDPLYGTVETYEGNFTGFVQWDHDERISLDKLDGDTRDGDLSIEFGKIASIERDGGGSLVILKSGRELYLRGSNDVNSDNRGIIVNDPKIGRVDIRWRDFKKVTFSDAPNSGLGYDSFKTPQKLTGTVVSADGESFSGRIVYDLDEEYDIEILQGMDNDIEYLIPFGLIKRIAPRNYSYSDVELKDGTKLLLGDSQDTDERHDGVLVFGSGSDQPKYIRWEDIKEVSFN